MRKPTRIVTGVAAALTLGLGLTVTGQPAQRAQAAAPGMSVQAKSCPAGMLCLFTKQDGKGEEYRYGGHDNHQHRAASVYYNYNSNSVSFWTKESGTGKRITGYKPADRGFRNWDKTNWDTCRSHVDRFA
ncbi:MAG: peptidase inhibitor family I36 protein [Bifidobacteriaceae bacterium]|jgi:hypothetical protein|nr:peptidase inhibitor family I36 protein [Bifidobacteriaceae bacterium]